MAAGSGSGGAAEESYSSAWPSPSSQFSAEEAKGIRAAFGLFDRSGSGTIAAVEVAGLARAVGLFATEEELEAWAGEKALPGGRLDYEGAVAVLARIAGRPDSARAMRRNLEAFDTEGTGSIRVADFRKALLRIGDTPLEDTEMALADAFVEFADPDDTGLVRIDDFVKRLFDTYGEALKLPKPDAEAAKKKKK